MLYDNFCSSPWFHFKISYNGDYRNCRWYRSQSSGVNIRDTSLMEYYNSQPMTAFRKDLLDGKAAPGCKECYYQDGVNKLSGRHKQLLKSGVRANDFALTMRASPHYTHFLHSLDNDGHGDYYPTDLQIELSNVCNNACIMCFPDSSSMLENDYKKLSKINVEIFSEPKFFKSWSRDPQLVNRLIDDMCQIPNLRYVHLLGGETLYDESFYNICEALIEKEKAEHIILGTTTNGTVYNQRIEKIIKSFKQVHLGISIDAVSDLNDYIRYPSQIDKVKQNIERYLDLRDNTGLDIIIRITPNIFTIYELDTLFEYLIEKQAIAESCNILTDPAVLRIELLPDDIRQECLEKFDNLIEKYNLKFAYTPNIRNPHLINQVLANTIVEYRNFIRDYNVPANAEILRHQLVDFIKGFEQLRNNAILDYAPRYKDFLRHYGY